MLSSLINPKDRIYPLFALICSVLIFVVGLFTVKDKSFYVFLILVSLIYLIFGYTKSLIKVLYISVPFSILAGLLALLGSTYLNAYHTGLRLFVLALSVVLSLSIEPVDLVRCLNKIKFPRSLTLGLLISLRFIGIIKHEIVRINMAMKTRGVKMNLWNLKLLFRSFVMPLISRIISISDTLSVSLETRHFTMYGEHSLYKEVSPSTRDYIFLAVFLFLLTSVFLYKFFF